MKSPQHRLVIAFLAAALALATSPCAQAKDPAKTRGKIDRMARQTLHELLDKSEKARALYGKAVAYAVFDNIKFSLFLSGGGGAGVAVDKASGTRNYMRMGTAGLNIGLGGQKYQVVFFFEDTKAFRDCVNKGWHASAEANAVAGKAGANAGASFVNGMALFQLSEAGLMLQVDISGTKYWKWKKLN